MRDGGPLVRRSAIEVERTVRDWDPWVRSGPVHLPNVRFCRSPRGSADRRAVSEKWKSADQSAGTPQLLLHRSEDRDRFFVGMAKRVDAVES